MKNRLSVFLTIAFILTLNSSKAQDSLRFVNHIYNTKSFVYKMTNYRYLSNENGFLLDVYNDTQFLVFSNTGTKGEFQLKYYKDADYKRVKRFSGDTLKNIPPVIRFDSTGAIQGLSNWKTYRDIIVSDLSYKSKKGYLSGDDFNSYKDFYNQEINVRMAVLEEIIYMFSVVDDTFRTDAKYIRMRQMKSPFTKTPYFIQGSLEVMQLNENKSLYKIEQKHRAGAEEKQHLRQEAQDEMKKRAKPGDPVQEITGVEVNSEYSYYYNVKQQIFTKINLSDVIVLNNQANGNIRDYILLETTK